MMSTSSSLGLPSTSTYWQRLRQAPGQPALWLALAQDYAAAGQSWQAAYAGRQAKRLDPTLAQAVEALALPADAHEGEALLGRTALPEAPQLAERFAAQVARDRGDWLAWLYLARLREMLPVPTDAAAALEKARALEPLAGETLHWLGVWRLNAGDAPGAVAALSGLLDIRPIRFGSMMYLGEALLRLGQTAAAEKAFSRASLSPSPGFLQTLAARVYALNYWQEAIDVLHKALDIQPENVAILLALAKIQSEVYQLADCRQTLARVAALDPANAEARVLTAGLQGRMGDAHGHLATLQAAYAAADDPLSRLASSMAMTCLYLDDWSPAQMQALHRQVCEPIERAVPRRASFDNDRTPNRRLRLGLVSGDFHRQHPVNIFMLPVLLRMDKAALEVFVYHTGTMHDEYTQQARACASGWREAATLDDTALQQMIVADRIDILLDLAGHTSTHRLGVFAMRAAPVQATFLGYPHSTGLTAIDWLIGDAVVAPATHAELFSEGIAQLPDSVFCWAPVDNYPLPPPRPADAPLVFGSFNNAMKLTPRTVRLWSQVLQAVPDAQLLLKAPSLHDAAVCERFAALFERHGIARSRLVFRGPTGLAEMMQEYGDIDIGLDPTPYNGGTTTLQALWMGVPVVALRGGNFTARMGASFMTSLGQLDWIADDEAAYVAAAQKLAADRDRLRQGRAALRAQLAASPLGNIDVYVRHFEALLQRMWSAWCADDGSRLLAAASLFHAAQDLSGNQPI